MTEIPQSGITPARPLTAPLTAPTPTPTPAAAPPPPPPARPTVGRDASGASGQTAMARTMGQTGPLLVAPPTGSGAAAALAGFKAPTPQAPAPVTTAGGTTYKTAPVSGARPAPPPSAAAETLDDEALALTTQGFSDGTKNALATVFPAGKEAAEIHEALAALRTADVNDPASLATCGKAIATMSSQLVGAIAANPANAKRLGPLLDTLAERCQVLNLGADAKDLVGEVKKLATLTSRKAPPATPLEIAEVAINLPIKAQALGESGGAIVKALNAWGAKRGAASLVQNATRFAGQLGSLVGKIPSPALQRAKTEVLKRLGTAAASLGGAAAQRTMMASVLGSVASKANVALIGLEINARFLGYLDQEVGKAMTAFGNNRMAAAFGGTPEQIAARFKAGGAKIASVADDVEYAGVNGWTRAKYEQELKVVQSYNRDAKDQLLRLASPSEVQAALGNAVFTDQDGTLLNARDSFAKLVRKQPLSDREETELAKLLGPAGEKIAQGLRAKAGYKT